MNNDTLHPYLVIPSGIVIEEMFVSWNALRPILIKVDGNWIFVNDEHS